MRTCKRCSDRPVWPQLGEKMKSLLKKSLITGLAVVLPAALTYIVLAFVVNGVDRAMSPAIVRFILWSGAPLPADFRFPGQGFLLIFLFLFAVGLVGSNFFGKKIVAFGDSLLNKIPFVRSVYVSAKKVVDAVSQTGTPSFQQMVLVDYPSEGNKTLGVLCSPARGEIAHYAGEDCVNVFVPTTPNVTGGFLLIVPKSQVTPLDISVDEGFKTIISLGTMNPQSGGKEQESPNK